MTTYVESNIKIEILFDTITYSCLKIHVCKKSLSRLVLKKEDFKRWLNKYKDISVYLLFSATSIWFSRSPLSVVSACSIFQLKFSISASNWACWYSNCNGMISDVTTVHNPCLKSHQMFPGALLHVVSIWICVLQGVSTNKQICSGVHINYYNPGMILTIDSPALSQ